MLTQANTLILVDGVVQTNVLLDNGSFHQAVQESWVEGIK